MNDARMNVICFKVCQLFITFRRRHIHDLKQRYVLTIERFSYMFKSSLCIFQELYQSCCAFVPFYRDRMRRTDKICNNDTRIIHLPQLFLPVDRVICTIYLTGLICCLLLSEWVRGISRALTRRARVLTNTQLMPEIQGLG